MGSTHPSLGRDNHKEQVIPDRHPATVHNRDAIKIGSWNVRTLYQPGKLENVLKQVMDRSEVSILGVCETRWTRNGDMKSENHRVSLDHNPVICKMKVKLKKIKQTRVTTKLDYSTLSSEPEVRKAFKEGVKKRLDLVKTTGQHTSKWDSLRDAMVSTAEELILKKGKKSKNGWMTQDILNLMKERQKIKARNNQEYKDLDKEIKKRCLEAKETWLNRQCEEIEKEPTSAYKKIKELTGNRTCSSSGCIKSKEVPIIVEKQQGLERRTEYIGELFHAIRGEKQYRRT